MITMEQNAPAERSTVPAFLGLPINCPAGQVGVIVVLLLIWVV
jgi:hypothetical protein